MIKFLSTYRRLKLTMGAHVKNKCIWKYKLCNVVVYRICMRNVNISENIALILRYSKTGNKQRATCFAT